MINRITTITVEHRDGRYFFKTLADRLLVNMHLKRLSRPKNDGTIIYENALSKAKIQSEKAIFK